MKNQKKHLLTFGIRHLTSALIGNWYLLVFIGIYLIIAPSPTYAVVTNPALEGDLGNGNPANIFGRFLGTWWGTAYVSAAIIFLLYLAWGAIEMSISGSNKERVENAKNKIQNAFLGLALIAVSWALIQAIGYVLGIDILKNASFSLDRLKP